MITHSFSFVVERRIVRDDCDAEDRDRDRDRVGIDRYIQGSSLQSLSIVVTVDGFITQTSVSSYWGGGLF